MSHHTAAVITTPAFRRGQDAARSTAARYGMAAARPSSGLDHAEPEFRAGYRYEWAEYIAPLLGTTFER